MKIDRDNRIDNYFRDGLEGLNVIPPASVWDNIAEQLPQKAKSRSMFVWIAVAASFAMFAMVGGLLYYQNQDINSGNINQVASQPLDKKQSGKSENTSAIIGKSQVASIDQKNVRNENNVKLNISDNKEKTSSKQSSSSSIASGAKIKYTRAQEHSASVNQFSPEENTSASNREDGFAGNLANNTAIERSSLEKELDNKKTDGSFALLSPIIGQNIKSSYKSAIIPEASSKVQNDSIAVYESLYAYENIPEEAEKKDRWSFGGQMAPLYSYRDLKEVNSYGLPKSEINDIERGVVTYSSGVVVDFEASSRLSFQTGINYMKWGQEIDNISKGDLSLMKSAYVPKRQKGDVIPTVNSAGVIYDESAVAATSVPIFSGANNAAGTYGIGNMPMQPVNLDYKDIKQSFEFLEVPFLAKYKIINRKINVHLLGGVSTHFLVNDKSIIRTEDNITTKGETKKVETVNYSSSVGFGVAYSLNQHIKFSIEPTFKYYLNSFNSDHNVRMHPYTFGLYSGLLFRF